jgi:hypothetical protein
MVGDVGCKLLEDAAPRSTRPLQERAYFVETRDVLAIVVPGIVGDLLNVLDQAVGNTALPGEITREAAAAVDPEIRDGWGDLGAIGGNSVGGRKCGNKGDESCEFNPANCQKGCRGHIPLEGLT